MGYEKADAAKDTEASTSSVSTAWHDARDHATESGHFERGMGNTSGWDTPSQAHTEAREVLTDVVADALEREANSSDK